MAQYRVKWGFWFISVLCFFIFVTGPKIIMMLLNGEIAYEDGEVISGVMRTLMITLFSIVWILYLPTVFSILKIVFVYKCKPFEITPEGIKNTFICIPIFCIMVVRTVKLIPWESVKYIDGEDGVMHFRLRLRKVKCGLLAKLYLFVLGYSFCIGLAGPRLSVADRNLCMLHCKGYAEFL